MKNLQRKLWLVCALLILGMCAVFGQCNYNPPDYWAQYVVVLDNTNLSVAPGEVTINDCNVQKVFWWDMSDMVDCYIDANGEMVRRIIGYNWNFDIDNCVVTNREGYSDIPSGQFICLQAFWHPNVTCPAPYTNYFGMKMVYIPANTSFNVVINGMNFNIVNGKKYLKK